MVVPLIGQMVIRQGLQLFNSRPSSSSCRNMDGPARDSAGAHPADPDDSSTSEQVSITDSVKNSPDRLWLEIVSFLDGLGSCTSNFRTLSTKGTSLRIA